MVDESSSLWASHRPHRPWLAAALSFLFPGLGHAYAGRGRLAVVFAVPMLAVAALGAAVAVGALDGSGNVLLSSEFLASVLVVNGFVLAWRGVSIAHAGLASGTPDGLEERRVTGGTVALLLVLTVLMHAWIGVVVVQVENTLADVFAGPAPVQELPPETPAPSTSDAVVEPTATPAARWTGSERLNILLLGTDAAPGRETVLTDVVLLVSVDPGDGSAIMVSVPRDTGYVPLPDRSIYPDGLYPDKVNSLMAQATADPRTWCPDLAQEPEACGLQVIQESVGLYLGVEIHHYAVVDMVGFASLIDALGGVELCLPGRLVDPEFDGTLTNASPGDPLVLPAGCHQYGGLDALAYARSRKGWIEMPDGQIVPQSDFRRNERQQQLLLALRAELAEADTLLELPAVLRAMARTVSTDFPRDRAGELASLLPLITGPDIEQVVLGYPDYVDLPAQPQANYLLVPRREAIRAAMSDLFGADDLMGWYLGTPDDGPPAQTGEGQP